MGMRSSGRWKRLCCGVKGVAIRDDVKTAAENDSRGEGYEREVENRMELEIEQLEEQKLKKQQKRDESLKERRESKRKSKGKRKRIALDEENICKSIAVYRRATYILRSRVPSPSAGPARASSPPRYSVPRALGASRPVGVSGDRKNGGQSQYCRVSGWRGRTKTWLRRAHC